MKLLNKQKLEQEIRDLFEQLEQEGSAGLTQQRFNSGLAQVFEQNEITLDDMGGEDSKLVSILIADLRGFTSLAEKVTSAELISILNEFFSAMVAIIDRHGGHVNKFMGDSLISYFEHTGEMADSVLNVLHCAIEMQMAMDEVNKKSIELGVDALFMGIGLNTGKVVASVLGSSIYREYTVIGTTVNLASRIEAYTLRGQILISENTRQYVVNHIETGLVNEVSAKGLNHPVQFYELLAVTHPDRLELPRRDNRKSPRIPTNIPILYQLLDGKLILPERYEGQVVDISYGGMMLNASKFIEQFSDIKMSVNLSPLNEPTDIYAKALYVQKKGEGAEVGLEFTIIDDKTSAAVKTFVDSLI